jgi:hypothetical protein
VRKSVGGDQNAVKSAVSLGVPVIMGCMANKASAPGGLDTLTGMTSKVGGKHPVDNAGVHLNDSKTAGGLDLLNNLLVGSLQALGQCQTGND